MSPGGWGVNLVGARATVDAFEQLRFRLDGDTVYVVGPTVEYAIWHEIGTSKMEARPFAQPAAERVQQNLESEVGQFLDAGVLDAGEEALVRATALAVQREMQRIITNKDIVDTGTMRASVSIEQVQ